MIRINEATVGALRNISKGWYLIYIEYAEKVR